MCKNRIIASCLAICMLVGVASTVEATSSIQSSWRNFYNPCQTLINTSCTVCHTSNIPAFNPYGAALNTRISNQGMTRNAAFFDAEGVDSDGDGYTNGQEIVVDCTEPGAAGSHGVVAAEAFTWGQIKALYR